MVFVYTKVKNDFQIVGTKNIPIFSYGNTYYLFVVLILEDYCAFQ